MHSASVAAGHRQHRSAAVRLQQSVLVYPARTVLVFTKARPAAPQTCEAGLRAVTDDPRHLKLLYMFLPHSLSTPEYLDSTLSPFLSTPPSPLAPHATRHELTA